MFWSYLTVTLLMITSLLLIFIILLQRGRGGGLAGAFGGAGGQSALGTKAGDVFTRITIGLAVFWVFLACVSIYTMRAGTESRTSGLAGSSDSDNATLSPAEAEADKDIEKNDEATTASGDAAAPAANTKPKDAPAEKGGADSGGPSLNTPAGEAPKTGTDQKAAGETGAKAEGSDAPAGGRNGNP